MDYKGARELKPLKLFVESGGRDGGVDGGRIPIPEGMRTTEPEDFEAAGKFTYCHVLISVYVVMAIRNRVRFFFWGGGGLSKLFYETSIFQFILF